MFPPTDNAKNSIDVLSRKDTLKDVHSVLNSHVEEVALIERTEAP